MLCPQCHDFLKPDATGCRECGWSPATKPSPTPAAKRAEPSSAWSPPVPAFHEEAWRTERRMTPAEVEPFLAELRAIATKASPTAHAVDAAQTARYLKACAARRRTP